MRDDSLNSKVNSHAIAIKILEGQLISFATQQASKTRMENNDKKLVVVTYSAKVAIGNFWSRKLQGYSENQGGEGGSKEAEGTIRENLKKETLGGLKKHNENEKMATLMPQNTPIISSTIKKEERKGNFFKKFMGV